MEAADLSPEQAAVLNPDIRVVEAGPGSGKTRALVTRYLMSAGSAERGVGLLSFTNAAVDEARARAQGRADLLQAPHFVGTIDSFLHRFVVTPWAAPRLGKLPSYLRSWDDLPVDGRLVRLWDVPGMGVGLARFHLDEASSVTLDSDTLPWDERNYLNLVEREDALDRLLDAARSRIQGLSNAGVLDASTARVQAFAIIDSPEGSAVIERIARRFEEILVDEAQDCDGPEFAIIQRLSSHIRTVVVADPDQAIYEFRGSTPQLFLNYRDELPEEARCELTVNYRSSPAICKAVTSLRAASQSAVEPVEGAEGCPVNVLTGTTSEQRAKFKSLLSEHGIASEHAIVLAHRWSTAYSAAGRTRPEADSRAAGNMLAMACSTLSAPLTTPGERLSALHTVESIMLNLIDWPGGVPTTSKEERLGLISKTSDWLRVEAGKLVAELKRVSDPSEFGVTARAHLGSALAGISLPHVSLGNRVQKPSNAVWQKCNAQLEAAEPLRCGSVHGAKGQEFRAVMVALPSSLPKVDGRDVLDDWGGGFNTEQRRVLYVASSRPERLLAYGAGPNAARLRSLLESCGVPTEVR